MSLEAAIQELIKTNLSLIEVIKADGALRIEIKDKIEAEAKRKAGDAAPATTKAKKADTADRQITDSPEDRKPAEEKKAAASDELAPEVKKAQEEVAAFVGAAKGEDDRAQRKSDVKKLLGKLNVERTSELSASDAVRLSGAIAKLVERYAPKPAEDDLL